MRKLYTLLTAIIITSSAFAQSLQKDNPINNMLYLDSDQIIPYAVKAIQEQQKIIELLSSRLDELENKIK